MALRQGSARVIVPVAVVLCGLGVMVWLVQSTPAPQAQSEPQPLPEVVVETIVPRTAVIPVVGYGTVRPKNQVQIVPQVGGELVYAHPDLAGGKIIAKGELLFELDPSVYQARVQQAEAEVRALEATCARHDQEMVNLDARIMIAENMLAIDGRDHQTSQRLLEQEGIGTQQSVDATRQKYLQRQDLVVQLKNQRATTPFLKRETLAGLDAARAKLLQARHDLNYTKIHCPFIARVESVQAHQSQMVTAHLAIATLTDMEAFELPISVDPRELRWLDRRVRPPTLVRETGHAQPEVKITWSVSDQDAQWYGHVARFERMDEATRTARMIVEFPGVEPASPNGTWSRNAAPAMSIGMHCRAELPAEKLEHAVLIPWHAIHEDRWVYVFEPAHKAEHAVGRLGRREVSVLRMIGDEVLVDYNGYDNPHTEQLKPGDQLVLSHPADPVVGMQVTLQKPSDAAPSAWDQADPAASAGLAEAGQDVARLAMSASARQRLGSTSE